MLTSFSHTAPRFTEEDRRREYCLLTDAERTQIDDDRKGTDRCTFDLQEKDRQDYVLQMEEELLNIPLADKQAYAQALIQCPYLVASESNSLKFLRKHNFNTAASAKNLIEYWTTRLTIFQDKAFLPMTLTGALQDDFDTLSTGFAQILPKDSHGRAVLYHEKHLANPKCHHRDSLLRVVFYIYHIISSDEDSQKKGFVLVNNSSKSLLSDVDRIYTKKSTLLGEIVPIKMKAIHVPSPDSWLIPKSVVEPVVMFLLPKNMRVRVSFFRRIEELEDYGLSMDNLPTSIGGFYRRSIEHWIEELRNQEEQETVNDELEGRKQLFLYSK